MYWIINIFSRIIVFFFFFGNWEREKIMEKFILLSEFNGFWNFI